jgi:hypothetical protein
MTVPKTLLIAACVFAAGCAHKEMTGEDHRAAAAADMKKADQEKAQFDPNQTQMAIQPRSAGFTDDPTMPPRFYNPSAAHLIEADRKMDSAFKHLEAARKLEKYEDAACAGISNAERMSCPVISAHLEKIEEGSRGIVIHLKTSEKAKILSTQMRCHLAFAQANNFESSPCPLYLKGVSITLVGDKAIEVTSTDAKVAATVREEARRMFGEPANTVSAR